MVGMRRDADLAAVGVDIGEYPGRPSESGSARLPQALGQHCHPGLHHRLGPPSGIAAYA